RSISRITACSTLAWARAAGRASRRNSQSRSARFWRRQNRETRRPFPARVMVTAGRVRCPTREGSIAALDVVVLDDLGPARDFLALERVELSRRCGGDLH